MKKIVLLLAFFAVSIVSNAQVWVGGTVGFSYQSNDVSVTEVGIAPMVRYDFNEKLSVGLELAEEFASADGTKVNTISFSPFVRSNLCNVGNGKFFMQASAGYGVLRFTERDTNASVLAVGLIPGLSFPLSEKAAFEVSLGGVSWAKTKISSTSSSSFGINVLSSISVGFAFKI